MVRTTMRKYGILTALGKLPVENVDEKVFTVYFVMTGLHSGKVIFHGKFSGLGKVFT